MTNQPLQIVLGSTSPFRKELLQRLKLDFITDSPDIDETPLNNESPDTYVQRLSLEKAKAVTARHPNALVIGSDQCSVLDGEIRGKPHTHENAIKQLSASSGKRVSFLTGLCVYDSSDDSYQLEMIPFHVDFRELTTVEIESYLQAEKPYNCAGSFKSEGLGITLFKRLDGEDPTALIGLPLIKLSEMLRNKGCMLP
ncbi:MAG: Maf family nucleotide pyrophosphatase [Cocleimonas sp.]